MQIAMCFIDTLRMVIPNASLTYKCAVPPSTSLTYKCVVPPSASLTYKSFGILFPK